MKIVREILGFLTALNNVLRASTRKFNHLQQKINQLINLLFFFTIWMTQEHVITTLKL